MIINDDDIEIMQWPQRPRGGQHTNRDGSGILVHHIPTGVAVIEESQRSQMSNKQAAMTKLRSTLIALACARQLDIATGIE